MSGSTQEDLRSSNVKTGQQVHAAFAKRDISAILSVLSPDVEWGEPSNPFNPAAGTKDSWSG